MNLRGFLKKVWTFTKYKYNDLTYEVDVKDMIVLGVRITYRSKKTKTMTIRELQIGSFNIKF